MNSDMRVMIESALEDTVSACMTLLTYIPNPYRTILLPIPTLRAFLARIIGLLECLPEIHKSKFHLELEKRATEFSLMILHIDDYAMLRHVKEREDYKLQTKLMLELFQRANLIYELEDSWMEMRKIPWETNKYPGLVAIAREQEKRVDQAKEVPLDRLLEQINRAHDQIAHYQGHRGEKEQIVRRLKYPEIHITAGAKARSLYEKTDKYLGK